MGQLIQEMWRESKEMWRRENHFLLLLGYLVILLNVAGWALLFGGSAWLIITGQLP